MLIFENNMFFCEQCGAGSQAGAVAMAELGTNKRIMYSSSVHIHGCDSPDYRKSFPLQEINFCHMIKIPVTRIISLSQEYNSCHKD